MQCPSCNYTNTRVLESRSTEAGQSIRRRRECLRCRYRFTTYERIEFVPIVVNKKDGTKESFDRSKVLRGMVRACEKTGISPQKLESIVDEIEAQLQQQPKQELSSTEIGELVLRYLRQISEVAYIRFASVYGEFTGIEDFVATLQDLQTEVENDENKEDWAFCLPGTNVAEDGSSIITTS